MFLFVSQLQHSGLRKTVCLCAVALGRESNNSLISLIPKLISEIVVKSQKDRRGNVNVHECVC